MTTPFPGINQKMISTAAPCDSCPFRKDVKPYLTRRRIAGIRDAAKCGTTFVCHKTVDYGVFGNGRASLDRGRRSCAGFLMVCQKDGIYGDLTIVQMAQRLGNIEFKFKGQHLVFNSFEEAIKAQNMK